ncbi:MAG: MBL fold metallo-hydrolase [Dehalococcoidales bacterium]|nr:MBL fold metallo-hydrolase [Dehalococcoidales bacterium]
MKIKWLGHSSFLITSDQGVRIITDPYKTGGGLKYNEISEPADIVTVSHEHQDHNNITAVAGKPQVIRGTARAETKGIKLTGIAAYHDDNKGQTRGANTIFCFNVDGIRICHLGDLGHNLSEQEVVQIGETDILLIPVGGLFTINADTATQVGNKLKPKVIIPMHYQNERCNYPISGVDDFLNQKRNIIRTDANEVEFKPGKFSTETQIMVLKPTL